MTTNTDTEHLSLKS